MRILARIKRFCYLHFVPRSTREREQELAMNFNDVSYALDIGPKPLNIAPSQLRDYFIVATQVQRGLASPKEDRPTFTVVGTFGNEEDANW